MSHIHVLTTFSHSYLLTVQINIRTSWPLTTTRFCCNSDVVAAITNLEEKSFNVIDWAETISRTFGVDVHEDDPMVNPQRICKSCRATLNRLKNMFDNNRATSTSMTFHKFGPHSDNCTICFPSAEASEPSRKRKKRRGGPGRGKNSDLPVPAPQLATNIPTVPAPQVGTASSVGGLSTSRLGKVETASPSSASYPSTVMCATTTTSPVPTPQTTTVTSLGDPSTSQLGIESTSSYTCQ